MVRRHLLFAQPFAQISRRALRQPPGIHEDERRTMSTNELDKPIVDLVPFLVGHHRLKR